ncbi:TonB-dependent siderophore receptor [Pseudomonas parafulva]|uniref:TonB-dependent siderophore receptor n=1 Tax=Pseudomonas parafulva TaxID=157782 RepID=A0AAI8PBQ3_9PSED|nr:TonB-dependent siderophore receptor [Pseudomonas parafulva]AXO88652.1 TonB-dependent siderophore receptor [Pseudomonas parafulva]
MLRITTARTRKNLPAFKFTTIALALGGMLSAQAHGAEQSAAPGAAVIELGDTTVSAQALENPTGTLPGKVALRNASATKSNAAITETPQSVSVVTADDMNERKADTLADALSYTPGFTSQPSSFNRTADRFRMRGFDVESATGGSMRDGMRLQNNSYEGVQEPFGLERVEVVRGAASVLYGQLSPGGFVNGISKRPTETPLHELGLQYGNHDRKQLTGDFSGPLGDSDTLSYRLTLLQRDSNTSQDHINDDKLYIAPALTWRPNEDTSLTLLSFYQKSDTRFSAPLPYQMVKHVGNGPFTIGRHDFIGEPSYDDMNGEMSAIGYEFEHRFDEHTRISNKLRYYESDVKWKYLQATPASVAASASTGVLRRQYSDRRERSRALASDTNVESRWNIAGMEHTFLVGLDTYDASYDSHNFRGNAPSLDLSRYNYGQPVVVNKNPSQDRGSQLDTLQTGLYFQDQIRFDERWLLLLGGRRDWADQDQRAFRNGQKLKQDDQATTWRAGLVYQADNGLAPYVSYSESFFPVGVAEFTGQTFDPTKGKQYEMGIRYQPHDSNMLLSAAVYELTQENVVKADFNGNAQQIGEQRSRGLELEAKADVTPQLTLLASYAYTDARITKSANPSEKGQRSEDTPYHQAALWADYNFGLFGVPQLKVGAGARYKGTTQASGIDSQMPAYTLFDLRASYQLNKNWDVAINANNVTNKAYTYCEFAICRYGDEREVVTSVNFRW